MSVSLKALLCRINGNSYRLFLLTVSIVQIIFIFKVVFPSETLELSKLFFETWTKKPIDVIQEAVEPLEKSDISVNQMKSLFGSLRDITSEAKLYFGSCCLIIAGVSYFFPGAITSIISGICSYFGPEVEAIVASSPTTDNVHAYHYHVWMNQQQAKAFAVGQSLLQNPIENGVSNRRL